MRTSYRTLVFAPLAVVALALPGCLERKETIRVRADGAVELRVVLEGDPGDFTGRDALPTERTGWRVRDEFETNEDGKQTQKREATMEVRAGQPLPGTYADERDELAMASALMFPTELTIEKRPDGTYYHFRRDYHARESARYRYYIEQFEKTPLFKRISEKEIEEISEEDRRELLTSMRLIEAQKECEYLRSAVAAAGEGWPQHYGLLLRQALLDHFAKVDVEPILALLSEPASEQRDAEINAYGERLTAEGRDALYQKLVELRVAKREIDAFFVAYEEEKARWHVTEDLGDEFWKVSVLLPGELVAHNGDSVDDGHVVWEFPGEALMDRDVVLMATSRVQR